MTPAARWALRGALALVGALSVGVLLLVVVIPLVTGGAARGVRSGSMAPAIPQGALVLDRPVPASGLHVGDVVTYGLNTGGHRMLVTHRIVAIDRSTSPMLLTLRGDANRTDDATAVPADAVRGRVWLVVPWLGGLGERVISLRWLLVALTAAGAGGYLVTSRAGRRPREEAV